MTEDDDDKYDGNENSENNDCICKCRLKKCQPFCLGLNVLWPYGIVDCG